MKLIVEIKVCNINYKNFNKKSLSTGFKYANPVITTVIICDDCDVTLTLRRLAMLLGMHSASN